MDRTLLLPAVVLVDEGERPSFHRELLASARKFRSAGWSDLHLTRYVRSIWLLIRYYIARGTPTLDEDSLRLLIWDFLAARLYGTGSVGSTDTLGLYWSPVRWQTMKRDCRAIADYSDYCAATFGYFPLVETARVPHKLDGLTHSDIRRLRYIVERSLLGHLKLLGHQAAPLPIPGRSQASGSTSGGQVLTAQNAWDIIEAEKNPVFRMVWTLGFWGGPRLSEQLNLWRVDVLPGALRSVLFDRDRFSELPLVVLANPWESTYCGNLGSNKHSRRKYLLEEFGLVPRPDMRTANGGRDKAMWAGWKGMLETNESRHLSQVYWANEEAAHSYMQLAGDLLERQRELGVYKTHPFMLVNLDPRRQDVLGMPLKLSNVAKAWERAVKRVGLQAYRFGASPHGMRHFYKAYLESLGVSRKVRQVALRHRSVFSQDAYGGLQPQGVWHALEIARSRSRRGLL